MPDGGTILSLHLPRPGEPELATLPGMAATIPITQGPPPPVPGPSRAAQPDLPAPQALPDSSAPGTLVYSPQWVPWTYAWNDPAFTSPAAFFNGVVTAPTPPAGTSTTRMATTEFVTTALGGIGAPTGPFLPLTGGQTNPVTGQAYFTAPGWAVIIGTNTQASMLAMDGPAASNRYICFLTAELQRWQVAVTSTAETGANVGSDFSLYSYTDTGAFLGQPLFIRRSDSMFQTSGLTNRFGWGGTQNALVVTASATTAGNVSLTPSGTGAITVPTAPAGTNTTQVASTAFVAAAAGSLANVNMIVNSGFTVNQRVYTSGTALAAGAFGHDRWKAGAGGGTYTFVQSGGSATTITITAGTLTQVVEGGAILTGNFTLSWTGTAQARLGAGGYSASPLTVALTGGTNSTFEFNTGTLSQIMLTAGSTAKPWIAVRPSLELISCQRFYQIVDANYSGHTTQAGANIVVQLFFATPMRIAPTGDYTGVTVANITGKNGAPSVRGSTLFGTATAAGAFSFSGTATMNAEL